jgi:hypothetical protein
VNNPGYINAIIKEKKIATSLTPRKYTGIYEDRKKNIKEKLLCQLAPFTAEKIYQKKIFVALCEAHSA